MMMEMDSDCGLNLKLGFDGSLQKVLMRTMVDQEDIFKNQVLFMSVVFSFINLVSIADLLLCFFKFNLRSSAFLSLFLCCWFNIGSRASSVV